MMENMYEIMDRIKNRNSLIKPTIKNNDKNNNKGLKNAIIFLSFLSLILGFLIYAKKDENAEFLKDNFGIEVNFAKLNEKCEKFINNFMVYEYSFHKLKSDDYVSLNDSYIGIGENRYYNSSLRVYAIDDGVVTNVEDEFIYIEHDNGIVAKYQNIANPLVNKFDRIKEYQVIALFNEFIELYFYKDGCIVSYEEIYNKNM